MEKDLISREALKKEIASLVVNGESRIYEVMPRCGGEWIDGIASAYREINNAPTVEERPQGEWILNKDENPECPFCHHSFTYWGNFCGNCGADMRQEETKDDG